MADVAQLVRAPDCDSGGRRFKTGHSPHHFFIMGVLQDEDFLNQFQLPARIVAYSCMYEDLRTDMRNEQKVHLATPHNSLSFYALVAQLDRALPSEGKGRWFKSNQVHHLKYFSESLISLSDNQVRG